MHFIIGWFLFGIVSAFVASQRGGSGCLWLIVGILLGPFGLILAFIIPGVRCPACKKTVHPEATKCPYCRSDL